jgi:hypothetical protein
MAPAYIFDNKTKQVTIMALNNKAHEEEVFEQVNFDDLVDSTEAEVTQEIRTVTGRETEYNHEWEIFKSYNEDVGTYMEGTPEVTIIEKDGKTYDSLCLRVIDNSTDEVLDCYCNFPKADKDGFVKNLTKDFDFYRNAFDFIFSVLKTRGDKYVLDKNGDEYDKFRRVDWMGFAKLVDQMNKVKVEITEGNEDSTYNSWMIMSME